MKKRRIIAGMLAMALAATSLCTGCQSNSGSSTDAESLTFKWTVASVPDGSFYEEYEDGPAQQYWLSREYEVDGETVKVNIDFDALAAGTETDTMNTLMATGEYPDVLTMSYVSNGVSELYEDGIILDLTDYIDQYMPNYKAWMEEYPEYADKLTHNIDGEQKYLELYVVGGDDYEMWGGYEYRRDWLAKYGTNPVTGEAFTGSWNEDKTEWTDDIVFPSGGSDPVYISDWEWMFEIFDKAMEDQGITDGFCFSVPYYGFNPIGGDFSSGFGSATAYYLDEDGTCRYGFVEDGTRAYIECLSSWYEKGWLDPEFDERTNDSYFTIAPEELYAGKQGCWYGLVAQLGNNLDTGSDYTEGICVYGAAQPINDVYGSEECQGKEPMCFYESAKVGTGVCITEKAADKNLPALLTAIDYLYSDEGACLRSWGLSKEQQAEVQNEKMIEWGLEDGTYEKTADGYMVNSERNAIDGLADACAMVRVSTGKNVSALENIDFGWDAVTSIAEEKWKDYDATGNIGVEISSQLTPDQSTEYGVLSSEQFTYLSQAIPSFIRGDEDIYDDASWQAYVDELESYGSEKYCEWINAITGK